MAERLLPANEFAEFLETTDAWSRAEVRQFFIDVGTFPRTVSEWLDAQAHWTTGETR